MDKIDKFIKRLSDKERTWITAALTDIIAGNFSGYYRKKLKGHANIYRIQVGTMRIFYMETGSEPHILMIERRREKTYRGF